MTFESGKTKQNIYVILGILQITMFNVSFSFNQLTYSNYN